MKAEHKEILQQRAQAAVRALYHNATLPDEWAEMPEDTAARSGITDTDAYFNEWLANIAALEIDFLNNGGACCDLDMAEYAVKRREDALEKGFSEKAALYEARMLLRRGELGRATNRQYERAAEFGEICQAGRGGRTVAPENLYADTAVFDGSGPRWIADKYNAAGLTHLCLVIESFNEYVRSWCAAAPALWAEHIADLDAEAGAET